MRVTVDITRRPEISDPQGTTIQRALHDLGHNEVMSVRVDRVIHLEVAGEDPEVVRGQVAEMCRKVLTNPVLEDFSVEVMP